MPDSGGGAAIHLSRGFSNFTAVPNEIVRSKKLTGTAKALYMILIDLGFRHEEPTQAELGELLGGGEKAARTALAELRGVGLLVVKRRGQGLPNSYTLVHPVDFQKPSSPPSPQGRDSRQTVMEGPARTAAPELPSMPVKTEVQDKVKDGASLALVPAPPPPSGQTLVAFFVDESVRLGGVVPARVKGQIAKQIGEMLKEGIAPERVQAGISLLVDRRLAPSSLPSAVNEASMPPAAPRREQSAAERMLARAQESARLGR